jgi:hypothetical protein
MTFALPCLSSLRFVLFAGLTASMTVPARGELRLTRLIPLPARTSFPGPGTATGSLAVPLRLLSFALPILSRRSGQQVPRAGFEPATCRLGGDCSFQLSYRGQARIIAREASVLNHQPNPGQSPDLPLPAFAAQRRIDRRLGLRDREPGDFRAGDRRRPGGECDAIEEDQGREDGGRCYEEDARAMPSRGQVDVF